MYRETLDTAGGGKGRKRERKRERLSSSQALSKDAEEVEGQVRFPCAAPGSQGLLLQLHPLLRSTPQQPVSGGNAAA